MKNVSFLLVALLVCTIFLPSINFAYADPVPQPITTGQIIHATTDGETLNGGLVIQTGGELIVDSGITLNINGALENSGKITIVNDSGTLSVTGAIFNSGEIIIDGLVSVKGIVINNVGGEIIIRCGDLDVPPGNTINNGIIDDTVLCEDGSNLIEIVDDIGIGETLTIDNGDIATITGTIIIQGALVNNGEIENRGHIILDGGFIQNIGTITNFCFNFKDRGVTVSGAGGLINPPGTINNVECFAPVANPDPPEGVDYVVSEDGELNVDADEGVLVNDEDVDNTGTKDASRITIPASSGTATLQADGSFTYAPNKNFFGTDTFEYEVKDGNDLTDTALVTIVVTPLPDAPIANPDPLEGVLYEVDENGVLNVDADEGVLVNDEDMDKTGSLTAINPTVPTFGTLDVFLSNGSFKYTPDENFFGTDTFEYEVKDGNENVGVEPARVTIDVTEVLTGPIANPDPPEGADYVVSGDGELNVVAAEGVLVNDVDVDETDSLTAENARELTSGTLDVFLSNGSFKYTPDEDFVGQATFEYDVRDGNDRIDTTTVTITVTEVDESLLEQKIDKIDELENLIDEATETKTVEEIEEAVKDLRKSTESEKWKDDGNSLVENEGKKVFKEQEKGVKHIMKVLKDDKESQDFLFELETIMLAFVDIDEQLAENEFVKATESKNPDKKELDKAGKEFEKVGKEKGKNHYDRAIKHLSHAWDKSVKAQNPNYDDEESILEDLTMETEGDEESPGQ